MKHKLIYEMLKKAGHSPAKALEIIISAKRGDWCAFRWIKTLQMAKRSQ